MFGCSGIKFNPATDIRDLSGKIVLVTGGTAGLGKQTVIHLVRKNAAHVYFSGRNTARAEEIITEIKKGNPSANVSFIKMDLASLKSVQTGAKEFLAKNDRLDILMCNAGILGVPAALTEDGYEVQMGTNHLGHALLMKLLLPTLTKTAAEGGDVRIISNTSEAYQLAMGKISYGSLRKADDFMYLGGWRRYGESKYANMLYAAEFARRYPSIISLSIHPGVIKTDMINNISGFDNIMVMGQKKLEPEEGVHNQLWAATTEKKNVVNGAYYKPVAIKGGVVHTSSAETKAKELWNWTEKELEGWNL